MRNLCRVSKIQKVESIKDKDRIELATVDNYPVIVEKGLYKVDDLCVYCEYDTVLPVKPEFEFLRNRCYSKLYNGFRIKNMKMAGLYSSGIVFPINLIDEKYRKLGKDLTDVIGVRKYDPEELKEMKFANPNPSFKRRLISHMMKYAWFRKFMSKFFPRVNKTYPVTVSKSSETNVERCFDTLPKNHYYYCTEKMEGQAGTWLLKGKTYMQFSHNVYRNLKEDSTWTKVGNKYNLEEILRKHYKRYGKRLAIQGEICGPGIQRNIYGLKDFELFVYKVTDVDSGLSANFEELERFCNENKLTTVPILERRRKLLSNVDEMLKDCEGKSVYKGVKREGIVWRSRDDQRIGCKCKSRDYQIWFNKKDITE